MEVDEPSGGAPLRLSPVSASAGLAPDASYGDARSALLSGLAAALAEARAAGRAPERLIKDALERHLGSLLAPPQTPEAGEEDKLASLRRQRRAEMRKLLDSQGMKIELAKIMDDLEEPNFDPLYNLLDASLLSAELGYSDSNTPMNMVEEVMDAVTIEGTERIFDWMELRSERLTESMQPNKGKGLTLLRLCNELLRRLSRTQNTVYSGRILMYLSTVYPLSERSGVNLRGDFNKDNVTHYEGEDIEDEDEPMTEEGGEGEAEGDVEARFYRRFWGMQRFLSNPPTILADGNFERFRSVVEMTLSRFEKIAADNEPKDTPSNSAGPSSREGSSSGSSSRKRKQRPDDRALGKEETFFFPKFLTSPKLFDLELRDPHFRRHILCQLLIIFQYLFLHAAREKERLAEYTSKVPSASKLNQPASTLSEEGEKWIEGARQRSQKIAEATPPGGRQFMKTVLQTLTHEKAWIKWKIESCYSFERPGLPLDLQMSTKRRKAETLPPFLRKEAWAAINAPAASDPLARLRAPLDIPTVESYAADVKADAAEYEDREERRASDPRVQWKAWRLVRKGNLTTFYRMANQNKPSKDKEKPAVAGTQTPTPTVASGATEEAGKEKEGQKEPAKEEYPDLEKFVAEYEKEKEERMRGPRPKAVKVEKEETIP
ncbi:THO complex subunit 1 transcription elongation factor-domain-containing protein [Hyaloraphidium curvatum]|nr:THO complex subunit 1 transcription elongation factor-domain-containing protein [Hyaloraphidium curvatum]